MRPDLVSSGLTTMTTHQQALALSALAAIGRHTDGLRTPMVSADRGGVFFSWGSVQNRFHLTLELGMPDDNGFFLFDDDKDTYHFIEWSGGGNLPPKARSVLALFTEQSARPLLDNA